MAGRDLEATAAGLNAVDLRAAVAQEFLDAVLVALDARWHNAAASNAVLAGINAKDALCFARIGRSSAGDDHKSAVNELRALGSSGR
jgi:hypothetical protein